MTTTDKPGPPSPNIRRRRAFALLAVAFCMIVILTGGFQAALLVLGAIGLIAVPAIFALVRRDELTVAAANTAVHERRPALAGAN